MPGPPRTPTPVLRLIGSRLADKRADEVQYPRGVPEPPANLSDEALAEWVRVTKLLHKAKVLQQADLAVLSAYCRCCGEWCRLNAIVSADGFDYGSESDRKLCRLLASVEDRLQRYAKEFGFIPASRSRVPSAPISGPLRPKVGVRGKTKLDRHGSPYGPPADIDAHLPRPTKES